MKALKTNKWALNDQICESPESTLARSPSLITSWPHTFFLIKSKRHWQLHGLLHQFHYLKQWSHFSFTSIFPCSNNNHRTNKETKTQQQRKQLCAKAHSDDDSISPAVMQHEIWRSLFSTCIVPEHRQRSGIDGRSHYHHQSSVRPNKF